jgi:hypothetical protein
MRELLLRPPIGLLVSGLGLEPALDGSILRQPPALAVMERIAGGPVPVALWVRRPVRSPSLQDSEKTILNGIFISDASQLRHQAVGQFLLFGQFAPPRSGARTITAPWNRKGRLLKSPSQYD